MKVELFELRFNKADCVYSAGEVVSGRVVLQLNKRARIISIIISFNGQAKSKWTVESNDSSKKYQAREVYLDKQYVLFRPPDQNAKQPAGTHVYPFEFILPPDIPSSFEGRRGYVSYNCLVTMNRGGADNDYIEEDLTVIRHLDLNTVPGAIVPQNLEQEEMYEGCCCDSGDVAVQLHLQKSGFVPGEPMNYSLTINNKATSSICGVSMALIQNVRYTGYSNSLFSSGNPKYHDKVNTWVLLQTDDEVGAGKVCRYNSFCTIPAVAPSLLEGCNIIDISYEVSLHVPVGWHTIKLHSGIFIGTIPLREVLLSESQMAARSIDPQSNTLPYGGNSELPPSYEECVFGRMESLEDNANEDDIDDDDDVQESQSRPQSVAAGTGSRRSRLRRLPSYPYYSSEQFMHARGPATGNAPHNQQTNEHTNNYPSAPPLPPVAAGYPAPPVTEQPSSLPPPPSYESIQRQQ